MDKPQLLKLHSELRDKMGTILAAKNKDYTGDNNDPFANFTMVEASGICSTEVGFLTRMSDKIARINAFVQKGVLEVKDESVTDTLIDLANYSLLLCCYIKEKNGKRYRKIER